jgi:hypothetical protein
MSEASIVIPPAVFVCLAALRLSLISVSFHFQIFSFSLDATPGGEILLRTLISIANIEISPDLSEEGRNA